VNLPPLIKKLRPPLLAIIDRGLSRMFFDSPMCIVEVLSGFRGASSIRYALGRERLFCDLGVGIDKVFE